MSLSEVTGSLLVPIVGIGALFLMGLFFLIAGLLTPGALERKGTRRFVHDRLLRLGIPFAVFTLLLWPLLMYAVREPFRHEGSLWYWFVHEEPILDNGPLWFVGVLLIYSLGYAGWRAVRPGAPVTPGALSGRTLVALGAAIALSSFVIRLRFAADTGQVVNLHLWEWPQCLGLFALGVASGRRGWLDPVPDGLRRRCGVVALAATSAIPALIFTSSPLGIDEDAYMGGLGWPSLATCLAEGALAVAGCVWVIGFARRRLTTPVRTWPARSAYAAFVIQGPVLLGLAVGLRAAPLPGDLKALLVASGGVAGSFLAAHPLVTRTPLGRIL